MTFLKARLKVVLLLKPQSKARDKSVYGCVAGVIAGCKIKPHTHLLHLNIHLLVIVWMILDLFLPATGLLAAFT